MQTLDRNNGKSSTHHTHYTNIATLCVTHFQHIISALPLTASGIIIKDVKISLASSAMKDFSFSQFYLFTFEKEKDKTGVALPVGDWCRTVSDCGTFFEESYYIAGMQAYEGAVPG